MFQVIFQETRICEFLQIHLKKPPMWSTFIRSVQNQTRTNQPPLRRKKQKLLPGFCCTFRYLGKSEFPRSWPATSSDVSPRSSVWQPPSSGQWNLGIRCLLASPSFKSYCAMHYTCMCVVFVLSWCRCMRANSANNNNNGRVHCVFPTFQRLWYES